MPFQTAKPVSAGDRFSRLVVIRELEQSSTPNGTVVRRVECRCDCGRVKAVRLMNLRSGKTKSCGCLAKELAVERGHRFGGRKKHGWTGTAEYRIWLGMKSRCADLENAGYGGRGIRVCERWEESFPAFLEDMGPRPSPEHSIDRYPDNNGNYEPGNCRWATPFEQARNRRNSVILEFDGRRMWVSEWAAELGVPVQRIFKRLKRRWSAEDTLKKPVESKHVSDPFYRIPIKMRDAAWYREYERRKQESA